MRMCAGSGMLCMVMKRNKYCCRTNYIPPRYEIKTEHPKDMEIRQDVLL